MSGNGNLQNTIEETRRILEQIKSFRYKTSSAQATFLRKIRELQEYILEFEGGLTGLIKAGTNPEDDGERLEQLKLFLASTQEISKEIEGVTEKITQSISALEGMDKRIEKRLLAIRTASKTQATKPQSSEKEAQLIHPPPESPPKAGVKTQQDLKKRIDPMKTRPKIETQDRNEKPQKLEKEDRDQLLRWYAEGREITIEWLQKNPNLYPRIRSNLLTLHNKKMVIESDEMLKSGLDKIISGYIKETPEGKFKNNENCMRLFCRFMAESKKRNQAFYVNYLSQLKKIYEETGSNNIKKIYEQYFPVLRTQP